MSTSVNTANLSPDWKQEVNRRIAAHRNNKAPLAANSRGMEGYRSALGSRAAEAAARVARRYAQAPSYSAMLADEAHAAVRAAEAAAKAAQDAQAAVQFMLEDLEAAASAPESATTVSHARLEILEPVLPVPDSSLPEFHELDERPQFSPLIQSSPRIQFSPAIEREESFETRDELRGADQPIYANLIEFPREMVATRRMRPRLAEGPLAAALGQAQLSIFEVDPGTISTEAAPTINQPAAPAWMRAEFATIAVEPQSEEDFLDQRAPQSQSPKPIRLAPLGRRSMALVVDASLVLAVFVFLAAQFASHAKQMPGPHLVEFGAVIAVLVISAAYHWLFLTLTKATPGMRYAGIALCTFDGHSPSREYRSRRLTGLLLSVLPLGLGLVWAFFDEDHLTWHDRLSKTYLRRR